MADSENKSLGIIPNKNNLDFSILLRVKKAISFGLVIERRFSITCCKFSVGVLKSSILGTSFKSLIVWLY